MSETRPPSGYAAQRVMSLALQTLEILRSEHGQIIEDDAALLDALAGEGVDVEQVLRRWVRSALDDKADAAAADARMDDLKIRRDRFRRHEEAKRATISAMMEAIGLTKLKDPEFSLSLTPGKPKVIVTNERALPDTVVNIQVIRTPNKDAIRAAIEDRQALIDAMYLAGEEPPPAFEGAVLSNGSAVLTIRSK